MPAPIRVDATESLEDPFTTEFFLPGFPGSPGSACYLRLHTELKLPEVFEMIKTMAIRGLQGPREVTGVQWNICLLLTGQQVKHSKSDEAFYIPISLLPGDSALRISWDEKILSKEEKRSKLRLGKVPRLLIFRESLLALKTMETQGWVVDPASQQIAVKEGSGDQLLDRALPRDTKIAQIVFYGHVSAQSWLKKVQLISGADQKTVLAEFDEPYEATVFDREQMGLPGSASPIFTFSFENYLRVSASDSLHALILPSADPAPILRMQLDSQFLPQNPVLQFWCIAEHKK